MKKITTILSSTILLVVGIFIGNNICKKEVEFKEKKINKFKSYYNVLNQWLILKQHYKNLSTYFDEHSYHTIAIYGMGEMGNRLYDELKHSNIEIKYGIDYKAETIYTDIKVYEINTIPENTIDAVVVTTPFAFDEIQSLLSKKMSCPILSLEDVICEIE